eukprot:m.105609 g.105609  ORF g.105609 m.105609 type:complete len:184 (+) comp13282_c0_seq4:16-567(+)
MEPTPQTQWTHPSVVAFHMAFRVGAVLAYIFCTLFSDSFVLNFVTIILLMSFDFWTVKNVSGRKLVGLRWWNQVDEQGNTKWKFESKKNFTPNASEARLFWWSLYIFLGIWIIFALLALIRLKFAYLLVVAVGIAFNTSNVVGYSKCQKNANSIQSSATQFITSRLTSLVTSSLTGGGATNSV